MREVNAWEFAEQTLPDGAGSAVWTCTRGETWRGTGSRVLAQFRPPADRPDAPSGLASSADGSPACGCGNRAYWRGVVEGAHRPLVRTGRRERGGRLDHGERRVRGTATGRLLALPARKGDRARLNARLADGGRLGPLR
ncbi:hypothetical protein NKH77_15050 [Streptomyces sp. M19]